MSGLVKGQTVYAAWINYVGKVEVVSLAVARASDKQVVLFEDSGATGYRTTVRPNDVAASREEALEKLRDLLARERDGLRKQAAQAADRVSLVQAALDEWTGGAR